MCLGTPHPTQNLNLSWFSLQSQAMQSQNPGLVGAGASSAGTSSLAAGARAGTSGLRTVLRRPLRRLVVGLLLLDSRRLVVRRGLRFSGLMERLRRARRGLETSSLPGRLLVLELKGPDRRTLWVLQDWDMLRRSRRLALRRCSARGELGTRLKRKEPSMSSLGSSSSSKVWLLLAKSVEQ